MACCLCANGIGAGGGGALATTARFCITAGGCTRVAAPAPSTACFGGAPAGATAFTCADASSLWLTTTRLRETGWAELNACPEVAVTAPFTFWFTYFTLLTFTLFTVTFLFTTVVL